jgi:four helix bundle protein
VELYKTILREKKEYVLSKQFVRSATSIGANVEEAIGGLTRADFSTKMSIAYKEARETRYWLRLLADSKFIEQRVFNRHLKDVDELASILFAILKSTGGVRN